MKSPRAEQVFVLRCSVVPWVSHSLSFMCGISHDETSASINFHTANDFVQQLFWFLTFSYTRVVVRLLCAKLYGQMNLVCLITNCNETRPFFQIFIPYKISA